MTAIEVRPEHEALRSLVHDFAEAEIAPHAEAWDRDHTFPLDTVKQMGQLGLFGLPFPEAYGGGGGDLTALCIAIEEIARADQSLAITLEAGRLILDDPRAALSGVAVARIFAVAGWLGYLGGAVVFISHRF